MPRTELWAYSGGYLLLKKEQLYFHAHPYTRAICYVNALAVVRNGVVDKTHDKISLNICPADRPVIVSYRLGIRDGADGQASLEYE